MHPDDVLTHQRGVGSQRTIGVCLTYIELDCTILFRLRSSLNFGFSAALFYKQACTYSVRDGGRTNVATGSLPSALKNAIKRWTIVQLHMRLLSVLALVQFRWAAMLRRVQLIKISNLPEAASPRVFDGTVQRGTMIGKYEFVDTLNPHRNQYFNLHTNLDINMRPIWSPPSLLLAFSTQSAIK